VKLMLYWNGAATLPRCVTLSTAVEGAGIRFQTTGSLLNSYDS
jgi:hypothetical protein